MLAPPDPGTVTRLRGRAEQIGTSVREALRAAGADALLLPLSAAGPVRGGARAQIAGQSAAAADLMAHCRAVSLTGLPALSVPAGTWTSVQLVGADHGEDQLCTVAAALTAAGLRTGA